LRLCGVNRRFDPHHRALAFFLIFSPDQEENYNNPFADFAVQHFQLLEKSI